MNLVHQCMWWCAVIVMLCCEGYNQHIIGQTHCDSLTLLCWTATVLVISGVGVPPSLCYALLAALSGMP